MDQIPLKKPSDQIQNRDGDRYGKERKQAHETDIGIEFLDGDFPHKIGGKQQQIDGDGV